MNFYRLAAVLMILLFAAPTYAYTSHIIAPAVVENTDTGLLTNISLNVTPGNGTIIIGSTGGSVGNDTKLSAITAVNYSTSYLKLNESKYNFYFVIDSRYANISGPSAGLAFTLLSISALKGIPFSNDFTVTGTINQSGAVGAVGGVFDKVQAAKSSGVRFVLVPYVDNSSFEYILYYMAQQVSGIPIAEVSNVSQAMPYAFGGVFPPPLTYNATTDYYVSSLQNASVFCSSCNNSVFGGMVNMTFNLTSNEINAINGSRFGSVKAQLSGLLSQYRALASKGYLYSGADLAFQEYSEAFIFANYMDSNASSAYSVLQNVSYFCDSLNNTPQLTNTNYEYVLSGNTRWSWAQITLSDSYSELNSSQTSDGVFQALASASEANAWCAATSYLYNASVGMGGYPVSLPQRTATEALSEFYSEMHAFGPGGLYIRAANLSIINGDFPEALYSLAYAETFYSGSQNMAYNSTNVGIVSNVLSSSILSGDVFPSQFALQGYFYLGEAGINSKNTSLAEAYLNDADSVAVLSASLVRLNSNFTSSFVNATSSQQVLGITQLSSGIKIVIILLVAILVVVIAILFVLILNLLRKDESRPGRRAR